MSLLATFYTNSNYGGSALQLTTTNFSVNLSSTVFYDAISSFLIEPGVYVAFTFWDTASSSEKIRTLRGPLAVLNLSSWNINDKSRRLYAEVPSDPISYGAQIYSDSNTTGNAAYIWSSIGAAHNWSLPYLYPNDAVSSIRIWPRTRIYVFKDANQSGTWTFFDNTSYTDTTDVNLVGSWNDVASSFQILQL